VTGRDKLKDRGLDGRVILKCILKSVWCGYIWVRL